jgi:HAMP domain-containing protein
VTYGVDSFDVQTSTVQTAAGKAYTVVVASPLDGVQRSINTMKGSLLTAFPFVVALVAMVAWLVVGRALQPVEAMRREVEVITANTMHRRVPEPRTSDEISRLAHTMNAMLDRLETSAAQQRQFVADASHELRSPIATIRAELEVALRAGERADWPRVAEGVLEEENRLEMLVADLLLLASVDEQMLPVDEEAVDLSAVVGGEAARSRRIAVTMLPGGAAFVAGRADQLARVAGNLLDNDVLFESPADWISPGFDDVDSPMQDSRWLTDPPANDGAKVIISDTDHYSPMKSDALWAWKSFLRGHNPILYDLGIVSGVNPPDPSSGSLSFASLEPARYAMGDTLRFAREIGLIAMEPRGEHSSTGYALANPGEEYLVLQPSETAEAPTVSLEPSTYSVRWFNVNDRETKSVGEVRIESRGGATFTAPFAEAGPAVLYLRRVER